MGNASHGRGSARNGALSVLLLATSLAFAVADPAAVAPAGAASNQSDATLVTRWGQRGAGWPGAAQFASPKGLHADADGNLYVADRNHHRIMHVTPTGDTITDWGTQGTAVGQFVTPQDVAVGPDGSVYVADLGNDRVQRFTAAGAFLSTWGATGSAPGELEAPAGIAVTTTGNVVVADTGNNRVQEFTAAGAFVSTWGTLGSANGHLSSPQGIAVGPDGTIVVADHGNDRVQRFTAAGVFVDQWDGGTKSPRAVDVGPDGRVYATDDAASVSHHAVFVLDADLNLVRQIGGTQSALPGWFSTPGGVTVDDDGVVSTTDGAGTIDDVTHRVQRFTGAGDFLSTFGSFVLDPDIVQFDVAADAVVAPNGDLYVVERENSRVQRLTTDGEYVAHWGGPGSGPGQMNAPESITVDASGDIYVADTQNDRVQRFSAAGVFEAQWGTHGAGNGQFDDPDGIAVDSTGDVFVADGRNDRIQRFSAGGTFEAAWGGTGTTPGKLDGPRDLVVGPDDTVYVMDGINERIQRFSRSGALLGLFGDNSFIDDGAQLSISTDATGNVLVVDGSQTVTKYTADGDPVSEWDSTDNGVNDWLWAIAVDAQNRVYAFQTGPASKYRVDVYQLPTGPLVNVAARSDRTIGRVGVPIDLSVRVTNVGTVALSGVMVSDAAAPGCAGPVPDLAPGDVEVLECTHVAASAGIYTHTATVDTTQTDPVVSAPVSVLVTALASPHLIDEWGVPGDGVGQLDNPQGIAVDASGDVLVANFSNSNYLRFGGDGQFEAARSTSCCPDDIEVDSVGNVFVSLGGSGTAGVASYTPAETPRTYTPTPDAGLLDALGIGQNDDVWLPRHAFQQCDDFGCVTVGADVIRRFSPTASLVGSFAALATDVAVDDARDRVYLASGQLVKTYTRAGTFLGSAVFDGSPSGLDLDASGNLYVAVNRGTGFDDRVQVYSPSGTLLAAWELPRPTHANALAVAPDGTVYVLDRGLGDSTGAVREERVRRYGFGLAGTVTDSATGDPVGHAWVAAIDAATGNFTGTTADGHGRYDLAVGAGSRLVEFVDPTGAHAGEWNHDVPLTGLADADPVTVTSGLPSIVDAALDPAGRTAGVAGTVAADVSATPLGGIWVGAVDLDAGVLRGAAITDASGHYAIDGLADGNHLLLFVDPTGAHPPEYADDSPDPAHADPIAMHAGEITTVDAGLATIAAAGGGATIAGTVTGGGGPLADAWVVALRSSDLSLVRGTLTDSAGGYALSVPPDSYRVGTFDATGAHAGEWFDGQGADDLGSSTPVTIGPGGTATVDADLAPDGPTGVIAGAVSGPDGAAVAGTWVAAIDAHTGAFAAGATVDADGHYLLGGLSAGDYLVLFADPSGATGFEWYDDAPDPNAGTPVAVAAGAIALANATLSTPAGFTAIGDAGPIPAFAPGPGLDTNLPG